MPSFRRILSSVADAYRTKRDRIDQTAAAMHEYLRSSRLAPLAATGSVGRATLDRAYRSIVERYDAQYGGFLRGAQVPAADESRAFCSSSARAPERTEAARHGAAHSFRQMARGGIYDQIGGGFHRYTVDEEWLVPHFEKMLYDNALLLTCSACIAGRPRTMPRFGG